MEARSGGGASSNFVPKIPKINEYSVEYFQSALLLHSLRKLCANKLVLNNFKLFLPFFNAIDIFLC